jgi:serine/threonine protein kinase
LGRIHQHNVVHRDINSNNVVFNANTQELQVIDFGISILLSRESPKMKQTNMLEGTLQYISPEQTGRMNRSLDYRTDLYSFGVLLFEMFCGRLPFPSNDPTELVHCHIAARPPLPEAAWNWPELPSGSPIAKSLSSVILLLLAKNKEDRYQSAAYVHHLFSLACVIIPSSMCCLSRQ